MSLVPRTPWGHEPPNEFEGHKASANVRKVSLRAIPKFLRKRLTIWGHSATCRKTPTSKQTLFNGTVLPNIFFGLQNANNFICKKPA